MQHYVDALNNKTFRSSEPQVNELLASANSFLATSDLLQGVQKASLILIYVDTPSGPDDKVYDHRNLSSVLLALVPSTLVSMSGTGC